MIPKRIIFTCYLKKIKKVVDEMITIYLDNLRTSKVKGGKAKKTKAAKVKPLKLPGLAGVNKKDPRDLLGEVIQFKFNFFIFFIFMTVD